MNNDKVSRINPRETQNPEMAVRFCQNCPKMIVLARVVNRVCDGGDILSNDGKFGVVEPLLILALSPLKGIGVEGRPTKGRS